MPVRQLRAPLTDRFQRVDLKELLMPEAPAKLIWNGQEIELPVVRGTEGECAVDISTLRAVYRI